MAAQRLIKSPLPGVCAFHPSLTPTPALCSVPGQSWLFLLWTLGGPSLILPCALSNRPPALAFSVLFVCSYHFFFVLECPLPTTQPPYNSNLAKWPQLWGFPGSTPKPVLRAGGISGLGKSWKTLLAPLMGANTPLVCSECGDLPLNPALVAPDYVTLDKLLYFFEPHVPLYKMRTICALVDAVRFKWNNRPIGSLRYRTALNKRCFPPASTFFGILHILFGIIIRCAFPPFLHF